MEIKIFKNYLKALRPKQWIKNSLVAAAPFAAGVIKETFSHVILGVVAFSLASSMGYLLNDWRDRHSDFLHPKKKLRPFASGVLSFTDFLILFISCGVLMILAARSLPNNFLILLISYLVTTFMYSLKVKDIPVVELIWLSQGFLIRALAGSTIIDESPSGWFVISIFFGSIFIVATKRLAETKANYRNVTRIVLKSYSREVLHTISTASVSITLVTYSLWIFQVHSESILAQFSLLPFSLAVFMYMYLGEENLGEVPEDLMFKNPLLIAAVALTLLILFLVIYI